MPAELMLRHLSGWLHDEALEDRYRIARVRYGDGDQGVARYSCERGMLYVFQLQRPYCCMVLGLRGQFHSCDYTWEVRLGEGEVEEYVFHGEPGRSMYEHSDDALQNRISLCPFARVVDICDYSYSDLVKSCCCECTWKSSRWQMVA